MLKDKRKEYLSEFIDQILMAHVQVFKRETTACSCGFSTHESSSTVKVERQRLARFFCPHVPIKIDITVLCQLCSAVLFFREHIQLSF